MIKFLAIVIALVLTSCSTIGARKIAEIGKRDLVRCCKADHAQYDLIATELKDGWLVLARPKHANGSHNELIFHAGGDFQLNYDRRGNLRGVLRGQ